MENRTYVPLASSQSTSISSALEALAMMCYINMFYITLKIQHYTQQHRIRNQEKVCYELAGNSRRLDRFHIQ